MILNPLLKNYLRPKFFSVIKQTRNVRPIVKIGKDKFQLCIDVHQFTKDEIRVKARPEYVIIEGKQERKTKNGCVVRQFVRKFKLPDGCNPQKMKSQLSKDGYLTITAPRSTCDFNLPCETVVPITYNPKKTESPSLIENQPEYENTNKMSFSPFFFDYDMPRWPRRLADQNFGLTLSPEDLFTATATRPISPIVPRYPVWWPKDSGSSIKLEKDKWQISVDVQHFAPSEITVKTVNGFIVVEGKHEEKQDEHGFISRQFVRRFGIPEDTDPDAIESRLSSDGVLTVLAARKDTMKGERSVPITHTGPVRKEVKDDTLKEQIKSEN